MMDFNGFIMHATSSGVFEILGAIGLMVPKTRVFAGYGLIALSIAVFPANINMALHPEVSRYICDNAVR